MKLFNVFGMNLASQIFSLPIFFYVCMISIVIFPGFSSNAAQKKNETIRISSDTSLLPKPVQDMRNAIIGAAKTGKLDAMKPVLEKNEILPIVDFNSTRHPIEYWKSLSRDGKGAEILAIMLKIFEAGYAIENAGKSDEKYIWPYHAELKTGELTAKQRAELEKIVPKDILDEMQKKQKYLFYRASITRDGTWHMFVLEE